jgi:hypothetical protein
MAEWEHGLDRLRRPRTRGARLPRALTADDVQEINRRRCGARPRGLD